MDLDRNHRCTRRERRKCGVTVPHIAYPMSIILGHIETYTHNHIHGKTLNVQTSVGGVRGCNGYEVVPTNAIRNTLILEFHT